MPTIRDTRDTPGEAAGPPGLPHERSTTGISLAVAAGGFWGLVGYTVLWEGEPFAVTRTFVSSVVGLLALLPIRLVIWGIRAAEEIEGRTFDLSSTHLWIAPVASAIGAAIGLGMFLVVRGAVRWAVRRSRRRPSGGFPVP